MLTIFFIINAILVIGLAIYSAYEFGRIRAEKELSAKLNAVTSEINKALDSLIHSIKEEEHEIEFSNTDTVEKRKPGRPRKVA